MNKSDMKFIIHPIIAFWLLVATILTAISIYPITYEYVTTWKYLDVGSPWVRAFIISVTGLFFLVFYRKLLYILKIASDNESDMGESLHTHIALYKKISITFETFCTGTVSLFRGTTTRHFFKILASLFFVVALTFGSQDLGFFFYLMGGIISTNIAIYIFFYILPFIFNLSYIYYGFVEREKENYNSKVIDKKYRDWLDKDRSAYDIIEDYIVPQLTKNTFKTMSQYLTKQNDIPSFLVSLTIMIYSYLLLFLFFGGKYELFKGTEIEEIRNNTIFKIPFHILSIWGRINPIVLILKLINVKVLYYLFLPLKIIYSILVWFLTLIINVSYIVISFYYSLIMLFMNMLFAYMFYVILISFISLLDFNNYFHLGFVLLSMVALLLSYITITYSALIALRKSYFPTIIYSNIKFLTLRYSTLRGKFKQQLVLVVSAFIITGIIYIIDYKLAVSTFIYVVVAYPLMRIISFKFESFNKGLRKTLLYFSSILLFLCMFILIDPSGFRTMREKVDNEYYSYFRSFSESTHKVFFEWETTYKELKETSDKSRLKYKIK